MSNKIIFRNESAGIYTKEFFLAAGQIFLQLAKRNQVPLLVAVINIDNYYKELSEKYGHDTGDKILEMAAKLIKDRSRSSDLISYMENGQIGLIYYNITNVDAKKTLESICDELSQKTYLINEEEVKLIVSIGGSIMHSRTNAGSINLLYEQACMGAESAQQNGDNNVVVY